MLHQTSHCKNWNCSCLVENVLFEKQTQILIFRLGKGKSVFKRVLLFKLNFSCNICLGHFKIQSGKFYPSWHSVTLLVYTHSLSSISFPLWYVKGVLENSCTTYCNQLLFEGICFRLNMQGRPRKVKERERKKSKPNIITSYQTYYHSLEFLWGALIRTITKSICSKE